MQNRLLALLLTALMVWTLAIPAMGANPFFDVPEDHWAYDAVEYLAEAGLIEGYPDGTFSGSRNFTRYEMALVFARIVARFEQRVDNLIAQGIDSRVEELSAQVATAMKDAAEALRAASEATQVQVIESDKSVDPQQLAEALAAAKQAQATAEQAMEVAIGTLEAIDARGWEQQLDGTETRISAAAARAQQALEAAEKAVSEAAEAMEVAIGTLEAIDAQGWAAQIDGATAEAQAASAGAAQALAAAEKALLSAENAMSAANEAMEVALGTLTVIDARDYDSRIDSAAASADQALQLAQKALASADEAIATANAAMEVAVGTLQAIDAREWDAQLSEALAKADQALALARSIAVTPAAPGAEPVAPTTPGVDPAAPAPMFTAEARAAIEEIAAAIVMDKLAEVKANADTIAGQVRDLRTDVDTAQALIRSEANRLEKAILDLTNEFATELEIVGVRVAALEAKFTALDSRVATLETDVTTLKSDVATLGTTVDEHGREIQALRADVDQYKISGFNEAFAFVGTSEGTGPFRIDPRNPDSDTFVPETGAGNRLQVRLDGKPNDEVDLVAVVDVVVDSRNPLTAGGIMKASEAYVEATSDRPVRVVRLGYLDANRVAQSFSSQLLHADAFSKTSNVGAFTNIVSSTTDSDLFAAYVLQDKHIVAGASTDINVGGMDVAVGAVKVFDNSQPRTGVSLAASGGADALIYSALVIRDLEQDSSLYKAKLQASVESATFTAAAQNIPTLWSDAANRLPFAAEVKPYDAAKADRVVDVNKEDLLAGESLLKGRVDLPVGSFMTYAQMGRYSANGAVDTFNQIGVYDLNLFGFDTTITRSTFVDEANQVLTDQRAAFATKLDDIDVKLELNRAVDGQIAAADLDSDRNQFMVSVAKPVNILVPWQGSVNFGVNLSDKPVADSIHSSYKLELSDYQVLSDVKLGAEISGVSNVITDGKWRLNSSWTGEDETKRAINAKWQLADSVNLTGAYSIVNNSASGIKITQDAGVEYVVSGAFGGDLTLGYGYRVVRDGAGIDGTPRNVLSAAFNRTAGGFTLKADAKRYMGGTTGESGNDFDTVASLQLTYPVFKGADLTVDGKYVSSEGTKAAEYQASSLTAGLRFNF